MKNNSQKEVLNKEEVIPAEDILSEEMEEAVSGGAVVCSSGCDSGGTDDLKDANKLKP